MESQCDANKQKHTNDNCDEESSGAVQGAAEAEKRDGGPWADQRRSEQRGREREGDTESEAGSRLRAVSTEPDAGLEPTNREIMT